MDFVNGPRQRLAPISNDIITTTCCKKNLKINDNLIIELTSDFYTNRKSINEIVNGCTCKYIGSLLRKAYSTIAPINELCEAEDKIRKLSSLNSSRFDKLIKEVEMRVYNVIDTDLNINDYNFQRKDFKEILEVIILQNIKQIFSEVIDEL